jgi:hypothetical protein
MDEMERSASEALMLVVAGLLAALALFVPWHAEASPTGCGKMSFGHGNVRVLVTKGNVSCKKARSLTRGLVRKGSATGCGGGMKSACVVGGFHCRRALAGERGKAGYCYKLRRPVSASKDFSIYRLPNFRVAVLIKPS